MSPPTYAQISRRISALLVERGEEWAGLPIPLPGLRLTLETKNPWQDRLRDLEQVFARDDDAPEYRHAMLPSDNDDDPAEVITVRNQWFSHRRRQTIVIYEDARRRVRWAVSKHDYVRQFQFLFDTMRAATAWTIDTEMTAMEKLALLVRPHLWEAYVLTGSFLETSARSGITYVFRRCRPTLAMRDQRLLCALCLHPTGYYEDTFAGSLCPTDDVMAHLLLMRGDEHLFWRRANQHHPMRPESGL